MRRADRLFALVQLIRGRRLSTAQWLAGRLQVSTRTVYRDVADLQGQGVPIEGEAGVGYRMRAGFDLPPLMFDSREAQALVASVREMLAALESLAGSEVMGLITHTPDAAVAGIVQAYEAFKRAPAGELPDLPFQYYTSQPLTSSHWKALGAGCAASGAGATMSS